MSTITNLTVLMTVYHRVAPNQLDTALQSLWDQTRPAAHVIVVIDGPIGQELDRVVVKHEQAHSEMTVLRCAENGGSGVASQAGLQLVETPWVARLDADDIARADRFEKQWEALAAKPELDVLGSAMAEFEGTPDNVVRVRTLPQTHAEIARYIKINSPVNNPSSMLRTAKVREVGGYRDIRLMEDYDLWVRLMAAGAKFENLPEPLVYFRADGMFERRTSRGIIRGEGQLQRTLVDAGLISWPRAAFNLAVRTLFRLLPTQLMSRAYRRLFVR